MNLTALPVMQGLTYRKDWADKLNLSAPVTIDDWHTLLTAFKAQEGAKAPLVLEKNGTFLNSEFLSAYGVGNGFYQVDGTAKYGYVQPGFKDYLTTMSKWYSEGLIDPNFTSNADITDIMPASIMADGTTGAGVTNWIFAYDGTYTIFQASKDPKINFAPVNNPVLKAGDTTHLRSQWSAIYNPWVVTTACKNPDIAVSLLDWCYDKDTSVMLNYGQLGTTYTMVNGKPQFTNVILADPKGSDKPTMWGSTTWENGPGLLDFSKAFQGMPANLLSTSDTWGKTDDAYSIPILSLTADEATQKAKIMADIETYVNETIPQFIMGTMTMDKFDSFVSQIQSMGIDKATAIEQAGLDRYNKR
jgi:putative aldouronate transport system substrate-binding protein